MQRYLIQRAGLIVPVLVLVSVIIFVLVRIVPGDIVTLKLGNQATKQDVAALRAKLGLDQPVPVQYVDWLGGIVRGNFGSSLQDSQPVSQIILSSIPVTLELAMLTVCVSLLIAIPGGVSTAVWQDTWIDEIVRLSSITALAVPGFWLATLVLTYAAIWFHWSPPLTTPTPWQDLPDNLLRFGVPALILGVQFSALTLRMTRSMMLDVLRQDYMRTARAKGITERRVVLAHGLRNALIPVITLVGGQFAFLLGGTVIFEQIFGLPGLGQELLQAALYRDYPVIQAAVLFMAIVFLLVNLLVDLLYVAIDPRIRFA